MRPLPANLVMSKGTGSLPARECWFESSLREFAGASVKQHATEIVSEGPDDMPAHVRAAHLIGE